MSLPQEKEKLYVELRRVLARQPGPEATEQLQQYRNILRDKTKQIKVRGAQGPWGGAAGRSAVNSVPAPVC